MERKIRFDAGTTQNVCDFTISTYSLAALQKWNKNPRIRFAITDLRQGRPVLTDFKPGDASDEKIGLMKSWEDSGATCAELLILDSMTNQNGGPRKMLLNFGRTG